MPPSSLRHLTPPHLLPFSKGCIWSRTRTLVKVRVHSRSGSRSRASVPASASSKSIFVVSRRRAINLQTAPFFVYLCGGQQHLNPAQAAEQSTSTQEVAYFAAGDPTLLAPFFRELAYRGVARVTTGSADGVQAVRVTYDTSEILYSDLLRVYFHHIDAADGGGQFKERGEQYAPAIWTAGNESYLKEADRALDLLAKSEVFGNKPTQPLAVKVYNSTPAVFTPSADDIRLGGKQLSEALKQSGRTSRLGDGKGKAGIWGYEEYCEARVCGYYVNAPRCQGTCRDYYVDGKLGLS
ncbi:peptide-methionine (S)-S-oxide reductase [Pycnococcus provasolii]